MHIELACFHEARQISHEQARYKQLQIHDSEKALVRNDLSTLVSLQTTIKKIPILEELHNIARHVKSHSFSMRF